MKPRLTLAETTLPDGTTLALQEHDGRRYLVSGGVETAGPRTRVSERELAKVATSPFRPARQPKVWIAGLGLGELLAAACEALPQKRGRFIVAEPAEALVAWHREFFPEGPLERDGRVELRGDPGPAGLREFSGELHAVLIHADAAPEMAPAKGWFEDPRWRAAAHDALQSGGLLAIASSRKLPGIDRALARSGFSVVLHEIDAIPNARRPKRHFLWLGRKGQP